MRSWTTEENERVWWQEFGWADRKWLKTYQEHNNRKTKENYIKGLIDGYQFLIIKNFGERD